MRRFVFPMKVLQWGTIRTETGLPLQAGKNMRAVGYIPVYESIQELVEDHGTDCQYGTFEENVAPKRYEMTDDERRQEAELERQMLHGD